MLFRSIFKAEDFEGLEDGQLPLLNGGKLTFPIKKLGKEDYNPLKYFFNLENLFAHSSWANTLGKENNYNHFIDDADCEKSLIFVKKSFLDKSKKVIFNNIKYLYYYCIRKMVGEESLIFWNKNERFKIPDSIKINNLETLHLSCGRKTSFKDLEKICGSNLKILVIQDMLVDDFSMPKMPKLEKMLINYGHGTWNLISKNNKKLTNFRNFENVPNLNELDIDIEYDCKYGIEIGSFADKSKIEKLKIHHLNPKHVNELAKIKSLTSLDISLWNLDNKVTEKDFEFLKKLKKLKKIKLSGGATASIFIDYRKVMTFLSKNIEDIEIKIVYKENDHKVAYDCISEINNRFKNLKKLNFEFNSCMIDIVKGFNFLHDINAFNFKEDKEVLEYSNKKTKFKSDHEKYKFNLDFKYLKNLKNLEILSFNKNFRFKTTISNENELLKFPKLTRIVAEAELFSINFFKKIKKRQDDFLNQCKKLKKYKSLSSKYDLEGDEWKQYEKLRIKTGYGYYGKEADEILKERKKKKN